MPIISGALVSTSQGREIAQKLVALTSKHIAFNETKMIDDTAGILLIAGLQELESSEEKVHILSDNASLFAGRLFTKDKECTTVSLEELPIEQIKESRGLVLGEGYWGRYLLISFDLLQRNVTIYRDPQGLSTIFYMPIVDGILFSTNIEFLYDAVSIKPELDWKYLCSFVISAHNVTCHTPFIGITEVLAGCATRLSCQGFVKVHEFWNPVAIKSSFIENEKAFQENIYQTFTACTAALARGSDKVVVELSGGLDSSSVLSVLKDVLPKGKEIIGINMMHSDVASSNETEYAKNVAMLCDIPLKVIDTSTRPAFSGAKISRRFNRPSSFLFEYEFNQAFLAENPMGKRDEIMCGQGGDHLFLAPPYIETVADYFLDRGFLGFGTIITEISAYYRMPFLSVTGAFLKILGRYFMRNTDHISLTLEDPLWMKPDFKAHVDPSIFKIHFWQKLKNVYPGKAQHIVAIYQATLYVDRGYLVSGKPVMNPFLSQPLIELALAMPTYQSFADGYNRIHFRRAMAAHKKGNYIWRKSKGETSGALIITLRKNYEYISNLLLEGRFVREGLVDKVSLNRSLNELRHGVTEKNLWPLLNLIVAEKWLNSWQ
jgi:asparagine synthase (glutamine-hydrolysing)